MLRQSPISPEGPLLSGIHSHRVHTDSLSSNAAQPSALEGRAALLEFALNIRDIVTSNLSMFEVFTPGQMKEFAVNMANAFDKFTHELETITLQRDTVQRELDECRLLMREREQCTLELARSLAQEHAKISTQIRSFQTQLRALSSALVLNSSCIMSVILPDKGNGDLSPVVQGDGSFQPLSVSLSIPQFPWPVSNFRCVDASSNSVAGSEAIPDSVSEEIMLSEIDVPRIWFHSCSPRIAESDGSLLRPFLFQQYDVSEELFSQQQRHLSQLIHRYPLSAVKVWSKDTLFIDASARSPETLSLKMSQARTLLQDSPILQSLQCNFDRQAKFIDDALQTSLEYSMWMIDDIFGEEAVAAKTYINTIRAGSVLPEDIQSVSNIISDSFQACAALHVHAAAISVDRHNNHVEYVQQSESITRMLSELKSFRLDLASKTESVAARDHEIATLRKELEQMVSAFSDNQSLSLKLQNALSDNAILRDRIQKLELRMLEQSSKNHRQRQENSLAIECLIYIAKVDFKGDGPNQLPLQKGDRIAVVVEDDLGWARGICQGKLGLFPSIICEKTSHIELVNIGSEQAALLEGAIARSMFKRALW